MNIQKTFIKREIAGDTILVPVGKTVVENTGLFVLNEVGAFLWDILPQAEDEEGLVSAVLAEYETDEQTARADIHAFLDRLRTMEIIK